MSIYLLPPGNDLVEITEVTKKAGVLFEQFGSLREMILAAQGNPICVGTLTPQDLLVLNRYARTLVEELPTVVMSAPGVIYTADWMSLASAFPAVDWKEILGKLSKSGHLATQPEQLEKRQLGPNVPDEGMISAGAVLKHRGGLSPAKQKEQEEPYDAEDDSGFGTGY